MEFKHITLGLLEAAVWYFFLYCSLRISKGQIATSGLPRQCSWHCFTWGLFSVPGLGTQPLGKNCRQVNGDENATAN